MAESEIKFKTILYSAIAIAVIFLVVFGFSIYVLKVDNAFVRKVEKIIPYPAAMVGAGNFIRMSEIHDNLNSVKNFYENQNFSELGFRVDFTTEEGKKRLKIREKQLLTKMIEDQTIELVAKKNGIRVTNKMVDESVSRELSKYGTEKEVKENLKKLYRWSLEDFKKKVVKPNLYRAELEKYFAKKDNSVMQARGAIQAAKKLLGEKEFSEAARKYSQGVTAENDGYIGWFFKDQLVPEVAEQVVSMKNGEISGIIESELGFHIVKLNDTKEEDGQKLYELSQIFSRKKLFFEWLEENSKKTFTVVFMPGYNWNKQTAQSEFDSPEMRDFEKKLMETEQSDPSMVF